VNPTKRAEYDEWRKVPAFAALATYHLIGFLSSLRISSASIER
jgi:hypothetical protein